MIACVYICTETGDATGNLARGKPTTQSATPNRKHSSAKAVDGKLDSQSCTIAGNDMTTWWQVDLEAVYEIWEVVLTKHVRNPDMSKGKLIIRDKPLMSDLSFLICQKKQSSKSHFCT